LKLAWENDLPNFESRFNAGQAKNRNADTPANVDRDAVFESVRRAPTYNDVLKTLSDDKPLKVSPVKTSPKKEKLRRVGLKMNSDDDASNSESDDLMTSSSTSASEAEK